MTAGVKQRTAQGRLLAALVAAWVLFPAARLAAQEAEHLLGRTIASVSVTVEGVAQRDPQLVELVDTRPGEPLDMTEVRATIRHLMALGRFEDVQVRGTPVGDMVALEYDCLPRREVVEIVFRGNLGLSRRLLRRAVIERHTASPPPERASEVAATLQAVYEERGFTRARVTPALESAGSRSRLRLVLSVEPGPRARYERLSLEGEMGVAPLVLFSRLRLSRGAPYDRVELAERIQRYLDDLHDDGYYEARLAPLAMVSDDGAVDLRLVGERGPRVSVVVTGVSLPRGRLDDLVPIEREGSADEDLLEDASRNIVEYLRSLGHSNARAEHRREQSGDDLRIVFDVEPGLIHRIRSIDIETVSGEKSSVPPGAAGLRPGDVFVQARLDSLAAALRQQYIQQGYESVAISRVVVPDPKPSRENEVPVDVRLVVLEGPRTRIGAVTIEGNETIVSDIVQSVVESRPGGAYYEQQLRRDAEAILALYLERGYQNASVEHDVTKVDAGLENTVDVRFRVREGEVVVVDRVLVTGNERTSLHTIRREIPLREGMPIGMDALAETQRRLSALGLFRRVYVSTLPGSGGPRRDVLVSVEEAPSTTIGAGIGVEGGRRLKGDFDEGGAAVESIDLAPRGSFEVGRRNLWGKNRSVNLFARGVLRSGDNGAGETEGPGSRGLGLHEYRVLATYREPRFLGTSSDLVVTGFVEQAVRSAFNFNRRGARAELVHRLSGNLSVSGRYSVDKTRLFNERIEESDRLDIDRLFPQIRLSALSATVQRDTRDDPINPGTGSLVLVDGEVAPRALGSEVGFVKTYVQSFWFRRMPGLREATFAGGVRLGLARGFARTTEVPAPGGGTIPIEVRDVPASERFFAGGDTTVRGFALDRLGTAETLDPRGVPKGGNALVILNGEMRVPFGRSFGGVAFLDIGNVFARVSDIDPGELRAGAGFGIRYRSPIGPVRLDLGFKLDRRRFADGTRESPMQWYVGIGHAF